MNYTEEDLRKLAGLIDDAYRGVTRDNTKADEIIEDFILNGLKETVVEEEEISFSYSFLRRKIEWEEFCDLTGIDYYAKANGYEIKDDDIFRIKESKAKQFNLI